MCSWVELIDLLLFCVCKIQPNPNHIASVCDHKIVSFWRQLVLDLRQQVRRWHRRFEVYCMHCLNYMYDSISASAACALLYVIRLIACRLMIHGIRTTAWNRCLVYSGAIVDWSNHIHRVAALVQSTSYCNNDHPETQRTLLQFTATNNIGALLSLVSDCLHLRWYAYTLECLSTYCCSSYGCNRIINGSETRRGASNTRLQQMRHEIQTSIELC